jgi:hypothetical protein
MRDEEQEEGEGMGMNRRALPPCGVIDGATPKASEDSIRKVVALGQRYMDGHVPRRTPFSRLFVRQFRYISPVLWATQLIVLAALLSVAFLLQGADDAPRAAEDIVLIFAPLTALYAVPELYKDVFCDMSELEFSCKNSGSKILMIRLVIIGLINLSVLLISTSVLACRWDLSFPALMATALVPYNCANIINLAILRIFGIRTRSGALCLSLVAAVLAWALPASLGDLLLASDFARTGIALATLAVLACQLAKEIVSARRTGRIEGCKIWNS